LAKFVIRGEGKENMDVVIALIVQETSDEGRQAICSLFSGRVSDVLDGDGIAAVRNGDRD
jgi:hypothetical protein